MNDLTPQKPAMPVQGKTTLSESSKRWQRNAGSLVGLPKLPSGHERDVVLSELKAALWEAGPDRTATAILRLQGHYWRPDFSPAQAQALYEDFIDDLGHIPPDILDHACASWRRRTDEDGKWFPKPGQLLAIAEPLLAERRRAVSRIEASMHRKEQRPAHPKRTPEEIARIDALVRSAARPMNEETEHD